MNPRSKRASFLAAGAILALALPMTFAVSSSVKAAQGDSFAVLPLGKPLPAFTLSDPATGKTDSLAALSAGKKATVVIFVSTHCPISNAYNSRMEQIATTYGPKGVEVIGINANMTEPADTVVAHAKANGFTFPVLKDADDTVANKFDAQVTPEVFVTDAGGVLVYHGPIDDSKNIKSTQLHFLADALDAVLAGTTPKVTQMRAFGCSIKR